MRENLDNIIGKFIEIRDLLKNAKEPLCDMTDREVLDEVYDKIDEISDIYKTMGSITEFKYRVDQRVWMIYNSRVESHDIKSLKYTVEYSSISDYRGSLKYQLYELGDNWFDVSQLFPSKEELIKSL